MTKEYDYLDKIIAIRKLVKDAAFEQRSGIRRAYKNPYTPEFDPASWQSDNMRALISALETTDALYVLEDLLISEEGEK